MSSELIVRRIVREEINRYFRLKELENQIPRKMEIIFNLERGRVATVEGSVPWGEVGWTDEQGKEMLEKNKAGLKKLEDEQDKLMKL